LAGLSNWGHPWYDEGFGVAKRLIPVLHPLGSLPGAFGVSVQRGKRITYNRTGLTRFS
jgi:hypothetical protein